MLYRTENPHGGDVYRGDILLDYSANINPLGTPPGVVEAMAAALHTVHHYPDPYCRALVEAIAAHASVAREDILCGSGAAELIYAYCAALRPRVAVELAPTFSEYGLAAQQAGCRMERYMLRQENDFLPDEGLLDYIASSGAQVVFLCTPNNPTGQLVPPALLEKVLHLCGEKGIRLFLDECFLDLAEGGVTMAGLLHRYPQLCILRAFTKSYGMAGVRLGYCLSGDRELLYRMSCAVQPWNVSTLAQAAGVAALAEREFLEESRAIIFKERRWLRERLEALGFWVCPSSANFLLLRGAAGLDAALRERGIAIRDCSNYHGLAKGWYRVAVRRREENERLIAAMEQVCGKERKWQDLS